MHFARRLAFLSAMVSSLLYAESDAAIILTPIVFGSEDSSISGFDIEDFEDSTLQSDLTVIWRGDFLPNGGPAVTGSVSVNGTLPNTFDPTDTVTDCTASGCPFPNNVWDGQHALTNGGFSDTPIASESNRFEFRFASITEFSFSRGMSSVGVGLSNFQSLGGPSSITNHTLFVNGQDLGLVDTLTNWTPGVDVRNIYLLVTATPGDAITSLAFQNDSAADGLVFDKLAFSAVPEPGSLPLLILGICSAFVKRRLRKV